MGLEPTNLFLVRNTKIFSFVFDANENFKICFRDLLTFSLSHLKIPMYKVCNTKIVLDFDPGFWTPLWEEY